MVHWQVCFVPFCYVPACAERVRTKETQQCFIAKRRRRPGAFVLCRRRQRRPTVEGKKDSWQNKPSCAPEKPFAVVFLARRQILSQIPKASAWDLRRFVRRCLWIYFPNTVEFFAFLKTVDPSADTNCCLFCSPLAQICEDYCVFV